MMKGVTTTLAQIQQRILQYVGPDTFLVGHSLENDLRVMKLVHLKVLDTAIMYPNARVRLPQCLQLQSQAHNVCGLHSHGNFTGIGNCCIAVIASMLAALPCFYSVYAGLYHCLLPS